MALDAVDAPTLLLEYAGELRDKWKGEIGPSIASMAGKVDAVLLESVDGQAARMFLY